MRRDPIAFFTKLAADYGDIVHFKLGAHSPYYLLNHPDYIKEVLVTQERNFIKWYAVDRIKEVLGNGLVVSEGEFHNRQRRLILPAFHRQRISAYADVMVGFSVQLRDRWQGDTEVDVCRDMNWLAMMIVAKTLFGADVESDAEQIREALSQILDQFERSMLPESERGDFESALNRLDSTIFRIIQQRRASGADRGDLLSMLLLAQDTTGDGGGMTDRQIRDEAMTIFLAGHETTANALAWSWYFLSRHPGIEEKFHTELDLALAGRLPTLDDVSRLPFATMIFAESLRMRPPFWAIGRRTIEACKVGEYSIPVGSVVILSQYVTHHDARYFPEPLQFDPQRWTVEAKAERPKFSYFPFSGGGRSCVGESFAWTEGVLCLATLAQTFRLHLVPRHPVVLQPQLTLRAKHGIKMRLEKRQHPHSKTAYQG